MDRKKVITIIISLIFIGAAGIMYSLEANKDSSSITLTGNLNDKQTKLDGSSKNSKEDSIKMSDNDSDEDSNAIDSKEVNTKNQTTKNIEAKDSKIQADGSENNELIYVHICGKINNPGVYKVRPTARVFDIVELAGGFTKNAAKDSINQAKKVSDGEKIYIPSLKEVKKGSVSSDYKVADGSSSNSSDSTPANENINQGNTTLVNINTASMEELMTLTGVGESKAKSIIEYRETNGPFKAIEDIKNIQGIKDGVFNKICDLITI